MEANGSSVRRCCDALQWDERKLRAVAESLGAEIVRCQLGYKLNRFANRPQTKTTKQMRMKKTLLLMLVLAIAFVAGMLKAQDSVPSYQLLSNPPLPPLPYDPMPWLETYTNPADGTIWVENVSRQAQVLNAAAGVGPLDSSGPPTPGGTNSPPPPWQPVFWVRGLPSPGYLGADPTHPLLWWLYRINANRLNIGWDWTNGVCMDDGDILWSVWPNETVGYATNWPYAVMTVALTNGSGVWVTNSHTFYMPAHRNGRREILIYHPTLGFTNIELMSLITSNYQYTQNIFPNNPTNGPGTNYIVVTQTNTTPQPVSTTNVPACILDPTNTLWYPWGGPGGTNAVPYPIWFTNGVPSPTNYPWYQPPLDPNPYQPPNDRWPFPPRQNPSPPVADPMPWPPGLPKWPAPLPDVYLTQVSGWQLGGSVGSMPTPPTGDITTYTNRCSGACGLPGTNYSLWISQDISSPTNWFKAGTIGIYKAGFGGVWFDTNAILQHWSTNRGLNIFETVTPPTIVVIEQ